MHYQQTLRLITCSLLMLALLFTGCSKKADDKEISTGKQSDISAPEGVVAMVNNVPIAEDDLDRELTMIQQRFYNSAKMPDEQKKSIKSEILEILINNELLYQASQQIDISLTDEEIAQDLKKAQEQYPTTENFTNTFTADDIKKKLSIEKFISQKFSDTTVISDETAKKYYQTNISDFTRPEQAFASHILIAVDKDADAEQKAEALEKITKIQEQLKEGKSFSELADQYSEDPKKMQGGSLGFVVRGQLDPAFEEAVFALNPGEISNIVQTPYGYHLITITDKKEQYIFPYEDIAEKLKAFLKQKEVQRKLEVFMADQREKSTITTYL